MSAYDFTLLLSAAWKACSVCVRCSLTCQTVTDASVKQVRLSSRASWIVLEGFSHSFTQAVSTTGTFHFWVVCLAIYLFHSIHKCHFDPLVGSPSASTKLLLIILKSTQRRTDSGGRSSKVTVASCSLHVCNCRVNSNQSSGIKDELWFWTSNFPAGWWWWMWYAKNTLKACCQISYNPLDLLTWLYWHVVSLYMYSRWYNNNSNMSTGEGELCICLNRNKSA